MACDQVADRGDDRLVVGDDPGGARIVAATASTAESAELTSLQAGPGTAHLPVTGRTRGTRRSPPARSAPSSIASSVVGPRNGCAGNSPSAGSRGVMPGVPGPCPSTSSSCRHVGFRTQPPNSSSFACRALFPTYADARSPPGCGGPVHALGQRTRRRRGRRTRPGLVVRAGSVGRLRAACRSRSAPRCTGPSPQRPQRPPGGP